MSILWLDGYALRNRVIGAIKENNYTWTDVGGLWNG